MKFVFNNSKYRDFSYHSNLAPAPTQKMIDKVHELTRQGFIKWKESSELIWALKEGELIRPFWEDYGWSVDNRGLPSQFVGFGC